MRRWLIGLLLAATVTGGLMATPAAPSPSSEATRRLFAGDLRWSASAPLAGPEDRGGSHYYAIKDPSFVRVGSRWYVFCTVRGRKRPQRIEYLTFTDWNQVDRGERHMLPITDEYFCAPAVFYFAPQKKWYLVYQYAPGSKTDVRRVPAFSTNTTVGDWQRWTKPEPLYGPADQAITTEFAGSWIDFWVICDSRNAYLFFTRDNGTMWRARTRLADFPHGWSRPVLALHGDIFEASHTYHVKGTGQYLTVIEAVGRSGRRYYKAYSADTLDGSWRPVADTWDKPFAGEANVAEPGSHWTDSSSHGELFRAGTDQTMGIEPLGLRMLFQGVSAEDMRGKPYGEIPWRLGVLSPAPVGPASLP